MTEPKRWSSSSSEVDPVLRSVLRYAQDLQPDSRQLQAILRSSAARRPTPKRRRLLAFVVASSVAACAGLAWAGYASGLLVGSAPTPATLPAVSSVTAPVRAHAAPPAAVAAPHASDTASPPAAPRTEPSAVAGVTAAHDDAPPHVSAAPPPVNDASPPSAVRLAPSASPEQDAALLQQARLSVATQPARALMLTRDHELHFPTSALTEERQALRIEALARLGRQSEATRDLSVFDQKFPRSIYRHRLHALLPN